MTRKCVNCGEIVSKDCANCKWKKIKDKADKIKQMMQTRMKLAYIDGKRSYKTGEI